MTFVWPWMLLLLLLVPVFVLIYLGLQRRRRRRAASYGILGLVNTAGHPDLRIRRRIPSAFYLAGLTVLLVALARPQSAVSLPRLEGTVVLAFDVSGSMAADDLKPTRLEAAKTAAREFVQRQPPSVQIGVVAFSGSGFAVQPPTNDQEAIFATIDRLKPELGTSIGQGIIAALEVIASDQAPAPGGELSLEPRQPSLSKRNHTSAVIVLLTDGENTAPPDPFEAVQVAMDLGVRIYTVGIGSPSGTTLNVNGFSVHTRLDEVTLREVARLTGGMYFNAGNEQDLRSIYENLAPELVIRSEKIEVTSIFVAASIVILLIGGGLSLLWFSRWP